MSFKKLSAFVMVLILAVSMAACGGGGGNAPEDKTAKEATRTFVDSAGREVEIPGEIDSIAPSGPLAQIVLYTACPDKLVGIATPFSDSAKQLIDEKYWSLPIFGQFYGKNASLNMEALIAANPDVIVDIGEAKDTVKEDMDGLQKQLNMPVIFIEATLDTMDEAYDKIGELIGDRSETDQLAAYCKQVSEKTDQINGTLKDEDRITVYEAMGDSGLNTNARGSFHAQIIDKAGGINAADVEAAAQGAGTEVSMEQILNWNPDVIIAESKDIYNLIKTDKTWGKLDAVKNGRVYKAPTAPYSALGTPPSVNRVIGVLWLGNILYPQQYGIDITSEFQKFYKLFYHVELDKEKAAEILGTE
ncbi:MAG TPA: ABC transporter substrate-binding protein [Bacillota bacterium]|nr:ABC transporter substrate-binding protein [Bacillota bacterium]